ncbi:MAG: AgmX/PglI C-terminal domain-containing protein [Myxococcales bacterium]|nr:AgmX/PglI C-terminal domain-containing protein [Myxococcales bacterium]
MTNKPAIAPSAICPFCKGKTPDDLIQFGGNCPHCLLEIPGEEAPTDPSLLVRKKLEDEAIGKAKQVRDRRKVQGVIFMLLLGALGGYGVWTTQQQHAALTYELPDDLYLPALQEASALAADPEPSSAPSKPESGGPVSPTEATPAAALARSTDPQGTAPPKALGDQLAYPPISAPKAAPTPVASVQSGGPRRGATPPAEVELTIAPTLGGDVEVADVSLTRSKAQALSDDDEIFAMIKEVMSRYQPQVRACYEARLKLNEGLAGAWKVDFIVRKNGSTAEVAVTPEGRKDSQLESCIGKTIEAWKFTTIIHDQPVSQTKRFGASGM